MGVSLSEQKVQAEEYLNDSQMFTKLCIRRSLMFDRITKWIGCSDALQVYIHILSFSGMTADLSQRVYL